MAPLFQNGAQGLHPLQRGGVLLLPADLPPPAVGAEAVVDVVDDPAEVLAPARKGVVYLVHRLRQRGEAFGHRFQPGRGGGEAGPLVPGRVVVLSGRGQPARRQQGAKPRARPGAEQEAECPGQRLDAEHPRHTAAPVGRKPLDAPCRGKHRRSGTPAGQPGGGRGKRRVGGRQRRPRHPAEGQCRQRQTLAAEGQLCRRTDQHPGQEKPEAHPAPCGCHGGRQQQAAHPRLFGREAAETQSQRRRQQGIPAAEQQELNAVLLPRREADGAPRQRAAACQHRRAEPARPEPPRSYGRAQPAEQTDALHRQRTEAPRQQPQRRPGSSHGKAVLPKAQCQPQPEGHQRPVQHSPASGQPQQKCTPLPQGGPHRRPRPERAAHRLSARRGLDRPKRHLHRKIPAFRRGSSAMSRCAVLFPAPVAYTLAQTRRGFWRGDGMG